jgi:hypothetical protein
METIIDVRAKTTFKIAKYFHPSLWHDAFWTTLHSIIMKYEGRKDVGDCLRGAFVEIKLLN